MSKLAVIRIAGETQLNGGVADTLDMLNLRKKYTCAVVEDNPVNKGMIQKVKDCVTYGPVDAETQKALDTKRKEGKKVVFLHPPIGGFERQGTKKSFTQGGALGDRGEKINDLIKKMIV